MANHFTNPASKRILDEAAKKHPDMPALTLAKVLFATYPGVFSSLDAVRSGLQYRYGSKGKEHRKCATTPRPKREAGEDWKQYLPDPMQTIKGDWSAVEISGPCKALILSDIHIPFHNQEALVLAMEYGRSKKADLIILNGDVMDCYAIPSKWVRDPQFHLCDEVRKGREFLVALRKAFPTERIVWKWGNHEERYERMMRANPHLYGIDSYEWTEVFDYKTHSIEHVGDKRPILLGKLNVIHGHEFGLSSILVNPARTFYTKAGAVHVLGGHFHQTSQHSANNLEQNLVSAWSTGCLCELHPDYRPVNQWSHGFAYVEVDQRGAFMVENKRIVDGRIW